MAFNVRRYLIRVRGGQAYLPVAARVAWFRDEHPDWSIETELVELNLERQIAVFRATIKDNNGRVIATATRMETGNDFADFLEKAETGAVGRALALCGYGTQFAPELSEGELAEGRVAYADSPLPVRGEPAPPAEELVCAECGRPLRRAQYDLSVTKFGRPLCPSCQRQAQPRTAQT